MTAYDPQLYALTHRGNPGDVAFYQRSCAGAESVLELGSGYGRLLGPLAEVARQVVGLELDAGLLRLSLQRLQEAPGSIELIQADMRRFDLARRFERIVLPYNGLYCLLDDDDVRACLTAVRRHLAPGGALLLDAYAMHREDLGDETADLDPGDEHQEYVASVTQGGAVMQVFERSRWDVPAQRLDASYLYIDAAAPTPQSAEYSISQRYLFADQLDALLADCGLRVEERLGDFDGAAFGRESPHQIVRALVDDSAAP